MAGIWFRWSVGVLCVSFSFNSGDNSCVCFASVGPSFSLSMPALVFVHYLRLVVVSGLCLPLRFCFRIWFREPTRRVGGSSSIPSGSRLEPFSELDVALSTSCY
ncbi:hypothetical protein FA15DRAFT_460492 [Coprinopsis marcescibilis]|uniref:Uncharacterized protein n=1 Tax=Coprinopsis marcescibilis TaxID=230819 RepID=A0A5C3KTE6_COPMA|nr:hypothetical protein FA15DRAFT_460492 [Coprinopsis marcescibilis]